MHYMIVAEGGDIPPEPMNPSLRRALDRYAAAQRFAASQNGQPYRANPIEETPVTYNHDSVTVERYSLPINQPKTVAEVQALMSAAITKYNGIYGRKPEAQEMQVEVQQNEGQRHLVITFEHRVVRR